MRGLMITNRAPRRPVTIMDWGFEGEAATDPKSEWRTRACRLRVKQSPWEFEDLDARLARILFGLVLGRRSCPSGEGVEC
jgi:PHD/YefM family antitoxin component YafN of YafNO toxin-antitoxin module